MSREVFWICYILHTFSLHKFFGKLSVIFVTRGDHYWQPFDHQRHLSCNPVCGSFSQLVILYSKQLKIFLRKIDLKWSILWRRKPELGLLIKCKSWCCSWFTSTMYMQLWSHGDADVTKSDLSGWRQITCKCGSGGGVCIVCTGPERILNFKSEITFKEFITLNLTKLHRTWKNCIS